MNDLEKELKVRKLWVSFYLVMFIFGAILLVWTLVNAVQKPAWVEIYTHPISEWLINNTTSFPMCNIAGCYNATIDEISTNWHYFLFGMIDDFVKIAVLSFATGMAFVMLLWEIDMETKAEVKYALRRRNKNE